MNLNTVTQAIKTKWETNFPTETLYLQLAPNATKPPYTVLRLNSVTPNEPTNLGRDWIMVGTFYHFDTSDSAILTAADAIVDAFDRVAPAGLYSSLVQSIDVDVNYTDQGALWSASIAVEFRWSS